MLLRECPMGLLGLFKPILGKSDEHQVSDYKTQAG